MSQTLTLKWCNQVAHNQIFRKRQSNHSNETSTVLEAPRLRHYVRNDGLRTKQNNIPTQSSQLIKSDIINATCHNDYHNRSLW